MNFRKIKQRFEVTGKKILPVFMMLFLFSAFQVKADSSPFCRVYLNDSLLPILFSGTEKAVVHIPHWDAKDTLMITYSTDTGVNGREQFIFRSKNDSTFLVSELAMKTAFISQVKLSQSELSRDGCIVFSGTRGFPQLTFFVFKIEFDS